MAYFKLDQGLTLPTDDEFDSFLSSSDDVTPDLLIMHKDPHFSDDLNDNPEMMALNMEENSHHFVW